MKITTYNQLMTSIYYSPGDDQIENLLIQIKKEYRKHMPNREIDALTFVTGKGGFRWLESYDSLLVKYGITLLLDKEIGPSHIFPNMPGSDYSIDSFKMYVGYRGDYLIVCEVDPYIINK